MDFSEIKNYLLTGKLPLKVSLDKKIETVKEHFNILVNLYGEQYAIKQMKIHIPHYLKGYPGINKLNKLLNGVKSIKRIIKFVNQF